MVNRQKVLLYLTPEVNEADRYTCQRSDNTPRGERGRQYRAWLLAGAALGKQDERLPYLFSEMLNEKTTFADLLQLMKLVFPDEFNALLQEQNRIEPENTKALSETTKPVTGDEDETRANAKGLFSQHKK